MSEAIAQTPIEKLAAVRHWVEFEIAETLEEPGGEFLLGIASVSVLIALDDIAAALSLSPAPEQEKQNG